MATYTKIIGLALVGSLMAAGCVISSDGDGSSLFDDDGGFGSTGDGDGDGNGDASVPPGDGDGDASVPPGDGDGDMDAGGDATTTPMQCDGPTGSDCATCVTNHCLAEFCACDADNACGSQTGEFVCMNECVIDMSINGEIAADAFDMCAADCVVDVVLADATNDLILCLRMGVPDPLYADAGLDSGVPEIAVCGNECFGYLETAAE